MLSVTFSVLGPKLLGNVTNLIFSGLISSRIPAGQTKAEVVAGLRAAGKSTQAKLFGAINLTPGHGVDFDQRRPAARGHRGHLRRSPR